MLLMEQFLTKPPQQVYSVARTAMPSRYFSPVHGTTPQVGLILAYPVNILTTK